MPVTIPSKTQSSWLDTPIDSDFPIQNIPFGVFSVADQKPTVGSRIGNTIIHLGAMHELGYFDEIQLPKAIFEQSTLNAFLAEGKKTCRLVRNRIIEVFDSTNSLLQNNPQHCERILSKSTAVKMQLPIRVGDFTDFYSSIEHATNVGTMFRGSENALMPNWLHLPVAYHGRSSSIITSGTPIHRPKGQQLPVGLEQPIFGPSKLLDFELEMAFITTDANLLGESISVNEAEDAIFGLVLLNDWSARDIQKWEYVPLGPFLGKNFASSISPWIITLDALEPFRTSGPKPVHTQLPYLQYEGKKSFDIQLEVTIQPQDKTETTICRSNFKYMYWNMSQQLAHHTVNGCPVQAGDLLGSGTLSGPTPDSYGSMLELTWKGQNPLTLDSGEQRKFIEDNDTVSLKGYCKQHGIRIGFGEVRNQVLAALP